MIIFTETLIIINIEKKYQEEEEKDRKKKKTSNMILMTFKNKIQHFFLKKNVNEGKKWKRRRNGIKYEKHKDKE